MAGGSINRKSMQPAPLAIDPGAANVVTPAANGTSPRIFCSLDHSIMQLAGLKYELEGHHPPQGENGNGGDMPSSSIDKLSPEVLLMRRSRLQSEWNEVAI
jgi:hypothetical protein